MQYSVLILYLFLGFTVTWTRFIDNARLVCYTFYVYICFAYQWAEIINTTWWINFIMQINIYSGTKNFSMNHMKQMRNREKWFITLYWMLIILYLIPAITLNFLTFYQNWYDCSPWGENSFWNDTWNGIASAHRTIFEVCSILNTVWITIKIIVGIKLLTKMRSNLNFFYQTKRNEIIITIVMTTFITSWKSTYNYFSFIRENDLKDSYMNFRDLKPQELPLEITVTLVDIFLPLAAVIYNIRTVNFRKYLKSLLKGSGMGEYYFAASLFVRYKKHQLQFIIL